MGRFKKRGIAHFGIDYFKGQVTALSDSLLFTLSSNSNMAWIDESTFIELLSDVSDKWKRYYRVVDSKTNIALAFIGLGGVSDDTYSPPRDFYEVTGQGLILRNGPKWFINLSSTLLFVIEKFIRIDVCLDLINVTVPYIHDRLMSDECKAKKSKVFYDKKEGLEQTIYFGEKSKEKNTYQLIRIYDKKADSSGDKHKEHLYPDHDKYENVTRLEVELREDLAQFWTVEKLQDINYIFAVIVKKFYRFNYQFFGFLKFDDFLHSAKSENSLYRQRMEKIVQRKEHIDKYGTSFKDDEEMILWKNTFITYGKRLLGDGYSPEELINLLPIPSPIDPPYVHLPR